MPHRIHKCTNILYDYDIIHYISLMYELKKNGKLFTSIFFGTGPLSYEKRIYRATAVSQRLRNTAVYFTALQPVFRVALAVSGRVVW